MKCLFFTLLLMNSGNLLLGQKNNNTERTLQETIQLIESASDYIFNYDPMLLLGYSYGGKLDLANISLALDEVFYDSPFQYEINGQTVLIYQPGPRSYRICGTLMDASSQEPLVAANIAVLDTIIGTQSDLSGYFDFEYTGHKNQQIEISYLGYTPIRFSLQEIKDNGCLRRNMKINQDLLNDEIIISDYLLDGISLGQGFTAFNLDFGQLSKSHSTVEHDILKTTQLLPGITSIDDSATNLQIRGSNPGQNLILWEGVPLYNAGHVFGMISAINPFTIENVSVYKGAYDPKYDNRVGGILDISLADELTSGFHGSIGTTFTELHGNMSIPVVKDKVTIELAGRQSINGIFNSPTLQSYTDKVFQYSIIDDQKNIEEGDLLTTEQTLSFHDWNTKVIYRPSSKLKINGSFYQNAQDFSYSFMFENDSFKSDDEISLKTQVARLETELEVTKNWSSVVSVYQSYYTNSYIKRESENEVVSSTDEQANNIKENSITFSNKLILRPGMEFNLGYEYNVKDVMLDLEDFNPSFATIDFERASFHNLFQSWNYTHKSLQLDIGNRTSYYEESNRWFHSPRINVRYAINRHLKLKADAGLYHQFISQLTNVVADQIRVDNPLWILNSTEGSLSQKATKMATGLVYQKGKWLFDLDAYYNHLEGISTVGPQLGIISDLNSFSKGISNVYGVDLLVKKRWTSGLSTWLSYSLGFSRYNFPDFWQGAFTAPNDVRHNISFVSSYTYKNFQISLNTNYHSGLPYSQARLALNEQDPNPEPPFLYYLSYDSYNEQRLDPYVRADLNFAYRFDFNRIEGSQIEVSCSLLNILNRKNIVTRGYYVDYNELTTEYKLSSAEETLLDRTVLFLLRFYW